MKALRKIMDSPKTASALLMCSYAWISGTGVVDIVAPHRLSAEADFLLPMLLGAVLAVVGGVLGGISVPRGVWWLERGAIFFMIGAVLCRIYGVNYQLTHNATTASEGLIYIFLLSSIVTGLLLRVLHIRGLALDPKL